MGNQVLNSLTGGHSTQSPNSTICPRAVFGKDIYGQPIDYDHDFYDFDNAFEMYGIFLKWKFSGSSPGLR